MHPAFPSPDDDDAEDVAWGLTTGAALWKQGERYDAIVWLKRAVDAAAQAGADAVKFQTFKPERLVSRGTPTAAYQASNCGASDQLEMLRALELPDSAYPELAKRCEARGIEFMSTPFDAESA
ncbi:MAG TPA: N-acetylneuraminate synthase family protein, partial [Polyangiaceae bacterium]|nr:N-acetylneuraminate synthase family protein [Polyangiaceae bacterium]